MSHIGRPISKHILVVNHDKSTEYVSKRQARKMVQDGRATWDKAGGMIHRVRGKFTGNFADHWHIALSDGVGVWQFR